MITLQTIRYFTETSPYHYTEDNKAIQDLEGNDIILRDAIDAITNNTTTHSQIGNWVTLQVPFDLFIDINKPFAYKIRGWAIQDQTVLAGQVSTLFEDIVFGYNNAGSVVVLSTQNLFQKKIGAPNLVQSYNGVSNNLVATFAGYTGANGSILMKAERFGL